MIAKIVAGVCIAMAALAVIAGGAEAGCLSWPVHLPQVIGAKFRDAKHPFRGTPAAPGKPAFGEHNGVDIYAPQGTPLLAPAGGEVVWVGRDAAGASFIAVETMAGRFYELVHLSLIAVRPGQRVRRGQFLGRTGGAVGVPGSGHFTTGPHLHLNLLDRHRVLIDPEPHFCK